MLSRLRKYIVHHQLLDEQDKILVAVSGGVDSMVLAHLLIRAGYQIDIAHCNFNLRGKDSDADEELVRSFAKKHQIVCHVKSFETAAYAKSNQLSTQMAARELRYNWFDGLSEETKFNKIATAHHANDALETSLFYLTKGGGLRGILGIRARESKIVRPVLFAEKDEILKYAKENHVPWRDDASNESTKYSRNFIRHEVVPRLKEVNPNIEKTFFNTHQRLEEALEIVNAYFDQWQYDNVKKENKNWTIQKEGLAKNRYRNTLLHMLLKPVGFNYSQIQELDEETLQQSGKFLQSATHTLFVDREVLMVRPVNDQVAFEKFIDQNGIVHVPGGAMKFSNKTADEVKISRNENIALLDHEKISFPLSVRNWKEGDRFQPLGMKGQKKLSDFFIDQKIPLVAKGRILVVQNGSDIVWVVGYRIDDRYKITNETKQVLVIEYTAKP